MNLIVLVAATIILEMFPISSSLHVNALMRYGYGDANVLINDTMHAIDFFAHGCVAFVLGVFFFRLYKRWFTMFAKNYSVLQRLLFFSVIVEGITVLFYLFASKKDIITHCPTWIGLWLTACILLSVRYIPQRNNTILTIKTAILLGLAQGIALLVPGISRLAITYGTARWCGFNNKRAFDLAWLIVWPLFGTAGIVGGIQLWCYHYHDLIAIISSGVFASFLAWGALWITQQLAIHNRLYYFGWYTFVLSIVLLVT